MLLTCTACRWLQAEWRNLGDMDAPEVDPLLQRASQALRARPALFHHCAHEVASARHSALFQRWAWASIAAEVPGKWWPEICQFLCIPGIRICCRGDGETVPWILQDPGLNKGLSSRLHGSAWLQRGSRLMFPAKTGCTALAMGAQQGQVP